MIFKYSAYAKDGKQKKGELSAQSEAEVLRILKSEGLLVEKISKKSSFFTPNIDNATLANLSRALAMYLKSGISLYRALLLLSESADKKRVINFLIFLSDEIKEGKSFFSALTTQSHYNIPDFYKYTIEVAEKSSNLEDTLMELSTYMFNQEKVRREVVKAFIYPGFIITVAIVMINFMLVTVVPNIVSMFEQTKAEIPTITKITLALSELLQNYAIVLLVLIAGFVAGFIAMLKNNEKFAYTIHKSVLYLPIIKKILINFELGRFCRVSSLLLQSGVPFAQAINFSSKSISNTFLQKFFNDISRQIVEGKRFSMAIKSLNTTKIPKDFLNAVSIGEDSSELSYSLRNLGDFYEMQNRDRIDVFLALLEPVLMLLVGGVIAFIVASMLLPIFSISIQ